MRLTPDEIGCLKWMVVCNSHNEGFLAPTVRKFNRPLPNLVRLTEAGYALLEDGYWITDAGRAALSTHSEGKDKT